MHSVSQGTCTVGSLFGDCCAAIRRDITEALDITDSGKTDGRATVTLAREGLLLTLGIAIPHLGRSERISAAAGMTAEGEHTFTFLSGGTVENAFLRRFMQAVADACGFSVTFLPHGICFTLKASYPSSLALRASLPEDDSYFVTLGLLLSGLALP